MKENKKGINYIKESCIDFYYTLKVETKLKYEEFCENIKRKISLNIDNYNMQVGATFKEEIEKSISNLNIEEFKNIKLKNNYEHEGKKIDKMTPKDFSKSIKNIRIEFAEKGLKFVPILELHEEINELEAELENDYETCLMLYGRNFVDNCQRFYLPPFTVKLINNENVFIKAVLYIFRNGMMVLRISIPLRNVDITPLLENNIDAYIANIIDEFNIDANCKKNSIEDIKNAYFKYIKNSNKKITSLVLDSAAIQNIILADFTGIPNNIRDIPADIEESLYRIIVAPITKIHANSFKDIARDYLENNSDTYEGIKYITNTMGKCISVIDKTMVRYLKENQKTEDKQLHKDIINLMRINIEFALIIILLKKINSGYTYLKKEIKTNHFSKVQKEYNYNNIFILQLQQSSFGSVREQIAFLEKKMTYFIAAKDTQDKMNAIDSIITEDRERKNVNFQNFLAIGGVLLTAVFGLPSIYDTLSIIKKCFIENVDIPIINIIDSSLAVWIILLVFLTFRVLLNKLNKLK